MTYNNVYHIPTEDGLCLNCSGINDDVKYPCPYTVKNEHLVLTRYCTFCHGAGTVGGETDGDMGGFESSCIYCEETQEELNASRMLHEEDAKPLKDKILVSDTPITKTTNFVDKNMFIDMIINELKTNSVGNNFVSLEFLYAYLQNKKELE